MLLRGMEAHAHVLPPGLWKHESPDSKGLLHLLPFREDATSFRESGMQTSFTTAKRKTMAAFPRLSEAAVEEICGKVCLVCRVLIGELMSFFQDELKKSPEENAEKSHCCPLSLGYL